MCFVTISMLHLEMGNTIIISNNNSNTNNNSDNNNCHVMYLNMPTGALSVVIVFCCECHLKAIVFV